MRIDTLDTGDRVLIVAEIGNNHEGSHALAEEMIGRAAEAGVDAVKLQTFRTEDYVSRENPVRFAQLKAFELTGGQLEALHQTARQEGLIFLSTPFDLGSAELLNPLVPAFKIASGDNTFYPLLETVAGFGKPMILSGGLADVRQLRFSKAVVESVWAGQGADPGLAVLHCVTSYPVAPEEANLGAIAHLRSELDCTVGYSDHTLGIEACVLAVALGARILEKHFTLDKHFSEFRDHQLSADPPEMAELVRRVRQATLLLGDGIKVPQPGEEALAEVVRRSIVARRDLPSGARITWADISWVRPAGGLAPGQEARLLGRATARAIAAGERLTPDLLEDG